MLARAPQQGKRLELRDLERAFAKLPGTQRSAILLVALEGMRYDEVAAVLGVPVGTIRSRLSRGREALRKLTGSDPEEEARPTQGSVAAHRRTVRFNGAAARSNTATERAHLRSPNKLRQAGTPACAGDPAVAWAGGVGSPW
jgi:hypothetical protein